MALHQANSIYHDTYPAAVGLSNKKGEQITQIPHHLAWQFNSKIVNLIHERSFFEISSWCSKTKQTYNRFKSHRTHQSNITAFNQTSLFSRRKGTQTKRHGLVPSEIPGRRTHHHRPIGFSMRRCGPPRDGKQDMMSLVWVVSIPTHSMGLED